MVSKRGWAIVRGFAACLGGTILVAAAQTTIDGTVSNAAASAPVTNATVAFWLDERTNWVAGVDDASDGWTVVHANGTTTGTYTRTFATSPTNVDMAVLAIGYQRGAAKLDPPSPVTTQTRRFELTPGTLRIEPETDSDATCQEHGYGGRPHINWDPTASNNRHITVVHHWTSLRTPLYFPRAAEFDLTIRYSIQNGASLFYLPQGAFPAPQVLPGSGNSWTTVTHKVLIDAPGWYDNFTLRAYNLGYSMNEYVDYIDLAQGDPLLSATVTGTATTNGTAVPYVTVVGARDNSLYWPGSAATADGTGSGTYSLPATAVHDLGLTALAIGCERQTSNVTPVAGALRDFAMTPGTMRVEAETDPEVTCQGHDEGHRVYVVSNGTASAGRYLSLSHNWDQLRNRLYFARSGQYTITLRYVNQQSGTIDFKIDNVIYCSFGTRAAWTVTNGNFSVATPGWHTIDVYAGGVTKGDPNTGIDYYEITMNKEAVSCTITGTVRTITGPLQNARVAVMIDQATAPLPGATLFADTDANGNYSLSGVAMDSVRISAQAPGFRRALRTVAPPTESIAANFTLESGPMILEPESDMQVTYQIHSDGFKTSTQPDPTCTDGNYLVYPHQWGRATARLYFTGASTNPVQVRYRTVSPTTVYLELDNPNLTSFSPINSVWTLPATAGAWVKTNALLAVSAGGWHSISLFAFDVTKAFPGAEGVDYVRIGEEASGLLMLVR